MTRDRLPLLAVLVGFGLSRLAYHALGVRFDASPLLGFWQYIDPQLLRTDLLESLWFLHSQPPLFNVYLGAVLKLAGAEHELVFAAAWLLVGAGLATALFLLIARLGAPAWVAAGLAIAFSVSPAAILFENWLYAEHLVAACLVLAALLLHRFIAAGRTRDAAAAFAVLAAVALMRPIFHLAWLLLIAGLVWAMSAGRRRQVLTAAAAPLLVCTAVYAKNAIQFDSFGATTCAGINAARMTTMQLDPAVVGAMIRRGELSRFARYSPFGLPIDTPEVFRDEPRRGVALLDRPLKSTRAPNLDHAAYLDICDRYLEDAVTVLRKHPGAFARGWRMGTFVFWRPPDQYGFFTRANREAVRPLDRVYGVFAYGQPRPATDVEALALAPRGDPAVSKRAPEVGWLTALAYLVAVAGGLVVLARQRAARAPPPAFAVVTAFVLLNVAWVAVVGTAFESGENNRFRFLVDPLVLALLAGLATRALSSRADG